MKAFGVVGLLATIWLAGAWMLMLMVGVVHTWWPLVPTLPFTVALPLAAIKMLSALIAGVLSQIAKDGLSS
jgi:hypothetical protein